MLSKKQWFYINQVLNPLIVFAGFSFSIFFAWFLIITLCNLFIRTKVLIQEDLLWHSVFFGGGMAIFTVAQNCKRLPRYLQTDLGYLNVFPYQKIKIKTLISLGEMSLYATKALEVKKKHQENKTIKIYTKKSQRSKGELFEIKAIQGGFVIKSKVTWPLTVNDLGKNADNILALLNELTAQNVDYEVFDNE